MPKLTINRKPKGIYGTPQKTTQAAQEQDKTTSAHKVMPGNQKAQQKPTGATPWRHMTKRQRKNRRRVTGERRNGGLRSLCWRTVTRHGNRRQSAVRNVSARQHAHQQSRIISGRCAKPSAGHMPEWDYISPMVRHSGNILDRKIAVSDGGRDFSRPYCISLIAIFIAIISFCAIVVVVIIREKNHERSRSKASFTFPEAD